ALVDRKRRTRERSVFRVVTALVVVLLVVAAGIGVNFIKPAWGYFGYKLVFKPKDVAPPPKPKPVEEAPPPIALPAVDADYEELAAADTYASYRLAAEQAKRAVDAGKAVTPFPDSAKKAAAQHVRFLSYLVLIDDLPAFVPSLRESLGLADGDEVGKAMGTATSSFVDREWDKGLAVIKPLSDGAHVLPPARKSEVWTWVGVGLRGKGDLDGAMGAFDNALQASTKNKLALYLQALTMSESGQPDAAREYVDKVLALDPDHPRANILKGKLLAAKSDTLEEGKKILVEFSEGDRGKNASQPERAQAFMGRAYIATSARQYPEALRYVQLAVELVPLNRNVRIQAAEMALSLRDYKIAEANGLKLLEANPEDIDGLIIVSRARIGNRDALGAYSDLQVAVKKAPNDANLNYWFGVAAREMSKRDEARAQFEKAAKLDPKRADPIVEIVYDLIEQGKLTDAVTRAGDAEEKVNAGDRYKVKAAKAYAYARRRQFPQAQKEYDEALKENPRDTD
ncbi:MAG TPA: tetratricopeptide repeat protein, partial [Myxococcota bacterium]